MRKWIIGAAILAAAILPVKWAYGQVSTILTSCATISYDTNQQRRQTIDTSGRMCVMAQLLASSSITTGQVTIGATATQIVPSRAGRRAVTITNGGTTDVMVGGVAVTTGTGSMLTGTKGSSMTIPTSSALYGIVGTGTQSISYLETY